MVGAAGAVEAKPEWVERVGSGVRWKPETAEPRSQPGKEETGQEDRVRVSVHTRACAQEGSSRHVRKCRWGADRSQGV